MKRLYRHTNHFMGTYAIFTETRNRLHRFTCFCFSTLHYQLYLQRCRPSGAWKWDDFFATKIPPLRGFLPFLMFFVFKSTKISPLRGFLPFLMFFVFKSTKISFLQGLKRKSIMILFLTFLRFNALHYQLFFRCRPYRAWKWNNFICYKDIASTRLFTVSNVFRF